MKSFLGKFYRHLAIFSGHTAWKYKTEKMDEQDGLCDGEEKTLGIQTDLPMM